MDLNSGNMLYYKGKEAVTHGGVGFLVKGKVITYIPISDRVAYIVIKMNKLKMKIIQASNYDDEDYEIFLEEITTAIEENKLKSTAIMGDFNAKIGMKTDELETKIGNFGYG